MAATDTPVTTKEKVLVLAQAHLPPVKIAASLGVTTAIVYTYLKQLRAEGALPPKTTHYYPETLAGNLVPGRKGHKADA